tara:strand:+ start:2244 stop:2507 length:264 start_codon:yes stop_codon:yes gene_type:complete
MIFSKPALIADLDIEDSVGVFVLQCGEHTIQRAFPDLQPVGHLRDGHFLHPVTSLLCCGVASRIRTDVRGFAVRWIAPLPSQRETLL